MSVNVTIDIPAIPFPQAPEGMPQATIHSIGLSDGSDLLCGVVRIGTIDLTFERGYLDAPTLIENPSSFGDGDMLEYPDWDEFLTVNFDVSGGGSTYEQYINDVIDAGCSRAASVMVQALQQAAAEILA